MIVIANQTNTCFIPEHDRLYSLLICKWSVPIVSDLCLSKFYKSDLAPRREVYWDFSVHFTSTDDQTDARTSLSSVVGIQRRSKVRYDQGPVQSLMLDVVADGFLAFSFFFQALVSFGSCWALVHAAQGMESDLFFSLNRLFPEIDFLLP